MIIFIKTAAAFDIIDEKTIKIHIKSKKIKYKPACTIKEIADERSNLQIQKEIP